MSDETDDDAALALPPRRDDTRRTSAEKLEALCELANDMLRVAARKPDELRELTVFAERMHRLLAGEF